MNINELHILAINRVHHFWTPFNAYVQILIKSGVAVVYFSENKIVLNSEARRSNPGSISSSDCDCSLSRLKGIHSPMRTHWWWIKQAQGNDPEPLPSKTLYVIFP